VSFRESLAWIWSFIERTITLLMTFWALRYDSAFMEFKIDEYNKLYQDTTPEIRQKNYEKIVNNYYNVSTLFYEWGWGPSFHFAPLYDGVPFQESLERHEMALVSDVIVAGSRVLDVGCGIGGPARHIAKCTDAKITGLNINPMQISKATAMTKSAGLAHLIDYVEGDFCNMQFKDETFDSIYAIEATCHAPRREDVFSEIFRVLKKGSYFVAYEWCITEKYDPQNPQHRSLVAKIEHGDGLSSTINFRQCLAALENVGFEIIEYRDVYQKDRTWWTPLVGNYYKPSTFEFTPLGKWLLTKALQIMETVHLAPKGVVKISDMLMEAAEGLTGGGDAGIYTPGFYFKVRRPL
jgi:sterol 24-C-methyltransferase